MAVSSKNVDAKELMSCSKCGSGVYYVVAVKKKHVMSKGADDCPYNYERRHDMAKKKAAKTRGKKPQRRSASTKQARKTARRSTGAARRSGAARSSGAAPAKKAKRKTVKRKAPARKAVRSGRTTARKTRKRTVTGVSRRAARATPAANESMAGMEPREQTDMGEAGRGRSEAAEDEGS
jgi:hypothetical protein